MSVTETSKPKSKVKKVRFKGISQDAITLGVSRLHLWKVLNGFRQSEPLATRYWELKRNQQTGKARGE